MNNKQWAASIGIEVVPEPTGKGILARDIDMPWAKPDPSWYQQPEPEIHITPPPWRQFSFTYFLVHSH